MCGSCPNKSSCPCSGSLMNGSSDSIQSWNDLMTMQPKCPVELIAYANIGAVTGSFILSDTFLITSGSWTASPFALASPAPICTALGADNLQMVADAAQWNAQHLTAKIGDSLTPTPLLKLMFLRGGTQWKNQIRLNLGGATYNDLQISFRDNGATRGDYRGSVPVVSLTGGGWTGNITLEVTLQQFGHFSMVIRAIDGSSNKSMYEMEWVVVP